MPTAVVVKQRATLYGKMGKNERDNREGKHATKMYYSQGLMWAMAFTACADYFRSCITNLRHWHSSIRLDPIILTNFETIFPGTAAFN
jgi:hypothetical protein